MAEKQKIKWLTPKQVKAAAKRGRKAAMCCSWVHWNQFCTATEKELRAIISKLDNFWNLVYGRYCALCQKYPRGDRDCNRCGLNCDGKSSPWIDARNAFMDWVGGRSSLTAWRKQARRMRDYIGRRIVKEYGKEALNKLRNEK